jgi:DNA-binding LacI/PurR family transcriptional regulator
LFEGGDADAGQLRPLQFVEAQQAGYAAVEQVIRRIAGTNDPICERVFSGELIVRGSIVA